MEVFFFHFEFVTDNDLPGYCVLFNNNSLFHSGAGKYCIFYSEIFEHVAL